MPQEKLFEQIEAEKKLLTFLLKSPRHIKKIVDQLKVEHFYREIYRCMYTIILEAYHQNRYCTVDMMQYELEKKGRLHEAEDHGRFYEMVRSIEYDDENMVPLFHDSIETLATIIIEEATYRQLAYAANDIMQLAYNHEKDAVQQAMEIIANIALGTDTTPTSTISEELDAYILELEQRRIDFREGNARGIPTGFTELDHMIGGLQPSGLYILAALTGLGKTALAVNIALNIALLAKRVLFFSLEMDNHEIVQRIMSMETIIDQTLLTRGDIDDIQMRAIKVRAHHLRQCDFLMDDRTYDIQAIVTKAKKEHAIQPLHLIVVDYVQLVETETQGKNKLRTEVVAEISRALKRLARELKVAVLGLAQVNRKVEDQQEPEPKLSHLSESAGLATNANVVMFLYTTNEELEKREKNQAFQTWVKVAKGRNERMGEIPLLFAPRITKFRTLEKEGNYNSYGVEE